MGECFHPDDFIALKDTCVPVVSFRPLEGPAMDVAPRELRTGGCDLSHGSLPSHAITFFGMIRS
jgi:hypothetical protein